jgi:hypothetical protein
MRETIWRFLWAKPHITAGRLPWTTSRSHGIVLGRNLRRKPGPTSPDVSKPLGHDLGDIRCGPHDLHLKLKGQDK